MNDEHSMHATTEAREPAFAGEPEASRVPPSYGDASDPRPAWRSALAWATLVVVLALGLTVDLWTKYWSFGTVAGEPVVLVYEEVAGNPGYRLPYHEGWRVLPWDLLDFRLVLNHGAVFGIGQNKRPIFLVVTAVAIVVAVAVFARWTRARSHLAHVAIGLILAGGLGNLWDRYFYGAVRDFLHMLPRWELPFGLRWPRNATAEVFPWVFNVADVMLLTGMGLLILYLWRVDVAARRSAADPVVSQDSQATG